MVDRETLTLLFNYGLPTVIIVCGLVAGVPYLTRKLDEVIASFNTSIQRLDNQNAAQRADYLASLREVQDKQNTVLNELLSTTRDTHRMVADLTDDFRSWNGIDRRRKRNGKSAGE